MLNVVSTLITSQRLSEWVRKKKQEQTICCHRRYTLNIKTEKR